MDECREQFEALMKAPPYEMTLDRYDDNGTWPGNYKAYHVQLAWCAWEELWNRRAMPAIPEGYAQCPVARVTGYFNGNCVVAPLHTAALLPVGMALFANAAPQAPVDGTSRKHLTHSLRGWRLYRQSRSKRGLGVTLLRRKK